MGDSRYHIECEYTWSSEKLWGQINLGRKTGDGPLGVGVGNCRGTGDGSGEKSVFSKLDLQRVDVYCKEN